ENDLEELRHPRILASSARRNETARGRCGSAFCACVDRWSSVKHWGGMSPEWHEHYERGRPGYPTEAVGSAELPASASVLEVGAGTGKLTRVLVDVYAHVTAVEPDPNMRRWFVAECPAAALIGALAEQIPLADSTVDAVFSAESFHWFAHERA